MNRVVPRPFALRMRVSLPLVVRWIALACAATAWLGPSVGRVTPQHCIVLLDASRSVRVDADDIERVLDGVAPGVTVEPVVFADGALALPVRARADVDPGALAREIQGRRPGGASDLAAGLNVAADRARAAGVVCEVRVLGDGRVTSSTSAIDAALHGLAASGCAVLREFRAPDAELAAHVRELRGPGLARIDEQFTMTASGSAGRAGTRLGLLRDGIEIDARDVAPGPFRVTFSAVARRAGVEHFAVVIGDSPDAVAADVVVEGRSRVVVVGAEGGSTWSRIAFGSAAERVGVGAADLRDRLLSADVVVVDAVPASELGAQAEENLIDFAARGGGVVLVGGPGAFGGGGGGRRRLDATSPLRALPPDAEGGHIYLALDGSGSMAEEWPGTGASRDGVVRAAATALATSLGRDVTLSLRRFSDRLWPAGGAAWTGPADAAGAAIADFPAPAGGTRLVPVLDDAARVCAASAAVGRHVIVFTDGRTEETAAALAAAVRRVLATGAGLSLIVDSAPVRERIVAALDGLAVEVVRSSDAAALLVALRAAAERAAGAPPSLVDVATTASDASIVSADDVPLAVRRAARTWPSDDASVVVALEAPAPLAAIRPHGAGRVAAVASGFAAERSAGDERSARLVHALVSWAARRAVDDMRVEVDADRVLVRSPGAAPASVEFEARSGRTRVALLPAPGGLWHAPLPLGTEVRLVRILDAGGATLGAVGASGRGAPEFQAPPRLARGRLAASVGGSAPATPLRPWLAAAAVVLLVLAHGLAAHGESSRPVALPM